MKQWWDGQRSRPSHHLHFQARKRQAGHLECPVPSRAHFSIGSPAFCQPMMAGVKLRTLL